MAMNWKQIETSREARLWVGQVIAPVVTLVVLASPETRAKVAKTITEGANKVKNGVTKTYYKVKSKFNKKKEDSGLGDCTYCTAYPNCPVTCEYFYSDAWSKRHDENRITDVHIVRD